MCTAVFPSENCFYLDDGTGLNDTTHTNPATGGPAYGIRVAWDMNGPDNQILAPEVGWFVVVVGISSSQCISTSPLEIIRVLRPRNQNDVYLWVPSLQAKWTTSPVVDPTGTVKLGWTCTGTFHHVNVLYYTKPGTQSTYNLFPLTATAYPDYRVWGLTPNTWYFRVIVYDTPTHELEESEEESVVVPGTAQLGAWYTDYLTPAQYGGSYAPQY